jgi:hypothetical protein
MTAYYPTLLWLRDSFDATGQRGSAAYFSRFRHPWRGWSAAYPETTGYIIETFLDYYSLTGEQWLYDYAETATDWVTTLQKPNGALPGLLGENGAPSVFNTGMMLFGLVAMYERKPKPIYYETIKKAVDWLVDIMEKDFSWRQAAYVENFTPTYYTRVVWAVLRANTVLQNAEVQQMMQKALDFYKQKKTEVHSLTDCAFMPKTPAFTHTLAYAQRGFLESGILLNDFEAIDIAKNIALKIKDLYSKDKKIAGTYDEYWQPDFSFVCVTGNCQLALNSARLFEHTGEAIFMNLAKDIFSTVEDAPSKIPLRGYRGGLAGSQPLWGDYRPFCYPNWAAKFWLDAFLRIK